MSQTSRSTRRLPDMLRLAENGTAARLFTVPTLAQFSSVCVAKTSVLPVGIAVVAADAVLVLLLVVRSFRVGLVKEIRAGKSGAIRGRALLLTIAGLATWTGVGHIVAGVRVNSD